MKCGGGAGGGGKTIEMWRWWYVEGATTFWVQHSEGKRILHAGNQREYQVSIGANKTYVDGFDPSTNTIYEFNGYFFHGCFTCFDNRDQTHPKLNHKTMAEVYHSTMQRIAHLQYAGYNVVVMWECTWKQLKQQNLNVQSFLKQLNLTNRLQPRDAFFCADVPMQFNCIMKYNPVNKSAMWIIHLCIPLSTKLSVPSGASSDYQ